MKSASTLVIMLVCMAGTFAAHPGTAGAQSTEADPWADLKLWYRQPADTWTAALPVGNGRLGAMVFGGTAEERLQLNEETLWTGGPYDPARPGGAAALPEIQRLVFAGAYDKAHDLFGRTMMGVPYEQMKYQPLANLYLTFPGHEAATDYRRQLDLDEAIATVSYRVGDVTYTREVFSSPVDQVIVVRLTSSTPGRLSFSANLHGVRNTAHSNYGTGYFRMDGMPPDGLLLTGKNSDYLGIEGKLRYRTVVKASTEGGTLSVDYRTLQVANADAATLYIAAATNFVNFKDVSGDPEGRVREHLAHVLGQAYPDIRARHVREHRRLFRRVAITLGAAARTDLPTDERLGRFAEEADPGLAALYFQMGRYLLLSSSRPGTQPANLQGIWNADANPSWDSKYTVNINLPMNYWPAEVANLPECFEPLFSLVKDVAQAGQRVAREHWGARGWVLHQNTDLWRATAPMDGPSWGAWPVGGAWLATHLWEHYRFNGDRAFLEEAYPLLRGAVLFLLDILVEHPETGWLVTNPSNSPENFPAWEGNGPFFDEVSGLTLSARMITAGPTMDMQIIRELFENFAAAADILNRDADLKQRVDSARARLAPHQIGRHGQLQEWLVDWEELEPHHRHLSHLWGVYPGDEISPEATPALAAAAAVTLERRGEGGCGWSAGHKMTAWARLLNGNNALHTFKTLMAENTFPNLFSRCARALQIDGVFGATAGIAEMLLQSQGDRLRFLPALPDAWTTGTVKGLRARGGFEVDLAWQDGRLTSATIYSNNGNPVRLQADRRITILADDEEIPYTTAGPRTIEFPTTPGMQYRIAF